MMKQPIYVAVTGVKHYFGSDFIKINQVVRVIKEPDNAHDQEAIKVEITPIGKIGYVANSTHTVPKGCRSAGRVYDTFDDQMLGQVRFVLKDTIIVELVPHLKEVNMFMNIEEEFSNKQER